MRDTYTTSLFIFAGAIFLCSCIIGSRDKTPLTRSIRLIMTAAPLTMAAYAAALLMPTEMSAKFTYAVYYAVSDWLLAYMFTYALKYTKTFDPKKISLSVTYMLLLIDNIILLLSVFSEKIFVFSCGLVTDSSGTSFYDVAERGPFYNFHRFIIYGMTILIIIPLAAKVMKSPVMYRKKYWLTLLCLLVIILANVIYLLLDLNIDFSVITYGLMAVAIYYFNVVYVPQGLMNGLLSSSIKNMDDSVICFDIEGNCIYANSVAYAFFKADNTDPFVEYYKNRSGGKALAELNDTSWKETRGEKDAEKHYDIQFKRMPDENGNYVGSFFMIHDETEDVKKLEAERFRATHDRLTGIFNREHFYEAVEAKVRNAEDGTYCMVCSDIKDFKLVNDIFGINTGDDILLRIADALKKFAGKDTLYARLSGDRFAVCMQKKHFNPEQFTDVIKSLSDTSGLAGSSYRIHVHLGVYDITDKNIEPSVMCDRAFMAIKTIKSSITDTIAYYNDEIRESTLSEQKVTAEFAPALAGGQFCFYLQPQVSVKGKTLGGEALVRWIHPDRGLVPPGEFIGILEKTGLICKLDMNTWELACKKLREWKDRGLTDYHISVNISPKDFYFADIYKIFTGLVEKYEINPKNLRLEITETAIMSDFKKQMVLIERLREYGFLVEMDDFGSGYSSLNMLKDMTVDTLKIDMGFLRQTDHAERSRTILKMIVSLSKQLGMEVVTEGVETKTQVDFLTDIGCDVFQGYYFAKPMPVNEFEEKYFRKS